MKLVVLGLSLSSSWGNGHATTYRGILSDFSKKGHDVLFLERDRPWYAANRDLVNPSYVRLEFYHSIAELKNRFDNEIREADAVMVGSYVPEGVAIGRWITGHAGGTKIFYDIDTPITLAKLEARDEEYLSRDLVPRYDLYLSFTGGPTLRFIEKRYGSPCARPLYCSVDPSHYYPETDSALQWELGYLGTYSRDRQAGLKELLIQPALASPKKAFIVAGPQYPEEIHWPPNVWRTSHLAPHEHRPFFSAQRFTLNVTRRQMIAAGYSPSVRLFEAAACGAPIISDRWPGLETFFTPDREILIANDSRECLEILKDLPESDRLAQADRARERVLREHTAAHRATQLEAYLSLHSTVTDYERFDTRAGALVP